MHGSIRPKCQNNCLSCDKSIPTSGMTTPLLFFLVCSDALVHLTSVNVTADREVVVHASVEVEVEDGNHVSLYTTTTRAEQRMFFDDNGVVHGVVCCPRVVPYFQRKYRQWMVGFITTQLVFETSHCIPLFPPVDGV